MSTIDLAALRSAIERILAQVEKDHASLTELDGKIGDGDLGITLSKAFRELQRISPELVEDIGRSFMLSGAAVSKVSSSSFGTLMSTGLMTVGKQLKGETSFPLTTIPGLLDAVVAAMIARGGAALGDKTVMDALDAIARATEGKDDPKAFLDAAVAAVDGALDTYRDKPNKVGRARIYADRSIGLDDAGMVAVKVMVSGLAQA